MAEEEEVFRLLFLVVLVLIIELKYYIYSAFTVIYVSEWSIVVLIFRIPRYIEIEISVYIADDSNDTDNGYFLPSISMIRGGGAAYNMSTSL